MSLRRLIEVGQKEIDAAWRVGLVGSYAPYGAVALKSVLELVDEPTGAGLVRA
jgi:hypothetical protein